MTGFDVSDIEASWCEVCGGPASSRVTDVREVDPVKAEGDRWFSRYEPADGSPHYFCDAHDRKALIEPRFKGVEEMRQWFAERGYRLGENGPVKEVFSSSSVGAASS